MFHAQRACGSQFLRFMQIAHSFRLHVATEGTFLGPESILGFCSPFRRGLTIPGLVFGYGLALSFRNLGRGPERD